MPFLRCSGRRPEVEFRFASRRSATYPQKSPDKLPVRNYRCLTIGFRGGRFIEHFNRLGGAIHRTAGGDSSWITSCDPRLIHRRRVEPQAGEADRRLSDRRGGMPEVDSAGHFLDVGIGVNEPDLAEHVPEFPLEILRTRIFLAELVTDVLPTEHDAGGRVDPAEPV